MFYSIVVVTFFIIDFSSTLPADHSIAKVGSAELSNSFCYKH